MNKLIVTVALCLVTFCIHAQIISTVAGTGGVTGHSGDGGPATAAQMRQVYGLALDAIGNIYIGESGGFVIRKVDPSGVISTFAGNGVPRTGADTGNGGSATAVSLYYMYGMCTDRAGNLYVHTYASIRRISPAGVISTVAGDGLLGHGGPYGSAATAAGLYGGYDVCVDTLGRIFFIDSLVNMVDTNGILTHFADNGTHLPYSGEGGPATAASIWAGNITGDNRGNIYLTGGSRICKVAPSGIITTIAGNDTPGHTGDGGPATAAKIDFAIVGMAADSRGNLFFVENQNHYIRKISASGVITTIAGMGTIGFSGDGGPATASQMTYPYQVKVGPDGNLYFADSRNYCIRKITVPTTEVTTPIILASANLYPNPAKNGNFTLQCINRAAENMEVSITATDGRLVAQYQGRTGGPLNIHIAEKGIFFVTITLPQQSITKQVVVE